MEYNNSIMKYILVRHVETTGNAEGRFNGWTESEYTPRGIQMKAILEDELVKIDQTTPIDLIYASPIARARIIGEEMAGRLNQPLMVDETLKEFNFGIFDGLTPQEAMNRDRAAWEAWMADYNHQPVPGGENYVDYHKRLKTFLAEHQKDHLNKTVLIIAHGGTVHSLLLNLLELPMDSKWHFKIELGGIAIIDCPEGYGILEKLYTPDYSEK